MTHNYKANQETLLGSTLETGIDELLRDKEERFHDTLDNILHSFLEQISHTLGEELSALLRREYVKLFGEVTFDDPQANGLSSHQKNLEIMSKIVAEIIQETLKNLTAI